jgi:hypothetical protein
LQPELDEGEDEDINKVILELQKRLFDQVVIQFWLNSTND